MKNPHKNPLFVNLTYKIKGINSLSEQVDIRIFPSSMVRVSRIAKKFEIDQLWQKTYWQIQFGTIYLGPRNIAKRGPRNNFPRLKLSDGKLSRK